MAYLEDSKKWCFHLEDKDKQIVACFYFYQLTCMVHDLPNKELIFYQKGEEKISVKFSTQENFQEVHDLLK